jgi:hypothetical protein
MNRIARLGVLGIVTTTATLAAGAAWYGRSETSATPAPTARRILYYVDPMHPAYRSERPGTAPDCGMALVAVYDDTAADDAVRVAADRRRLAGVKVVTIERTPASATLRLYGRVAADETRIHRVNAGTDGYIDELSAVATGSRVEAGQWLATLAAPDTRTPIQAFLVALDARDGGTLRPSDVPGAIGDGVDQAADRLRTLGMSPQQIAEVARTRIVPSKIRVAAPAAGFVIARTAAAGRVATGEELFRIADLRRVWIYADVPGGDAVHVRPGAVAEIAVPGRPAPLRASVSADVPPQFDPATQSVRVRLDVDNPGAVLRPDMFVDVRLSIDLPEAIAVPVDAVLDAGLKKRVFVERADGAFEPREVTTGWRFGDRVEIVSGLAEGERLVVSGTFLLDSESRLRHVPGATPPTP